MKAHFFRRSLAAIFGILLLIPRLVSAQTNAFTYQGQLNNNGLPANGYYNFQFSVYDGSPYGNLVGGPLTNASTLVSNGLFTVQLNFGAGVFTGAARWLQIGVQTNGSSAPFVPLSPSQPINSTPYAIQAAAANTANAANSVASTNITGALAAAQLPMSVVTNGASGVALVGTFSGNGSALTNLNVANLNNVVDSLQTNVYASAGTINFTAPPSAVSMTVKLWGAGGSGATGNGPGGGGAFSMVSLAVTPGATYTAVIGQGASVGTAGGAGSNDGAGGGSTEGCGGQASSLFADTGSVYIMLAVAGGGGGGSYGVSGGAGGNPGAAGHGYGAPYGVGGGGGDNGAGGSATSPGTGGGSYAASATTTGETSLNQMGGTGGAGSPNGEISGGGGGGYGGGGGGGGSQEIGGGGGGGSYGNVIIGGGGTGPGNTGDLNYISPAGTGGPGGAAGNNGLVVVIFSTQTTTTTGSQVVTGPLTVSGAVSAANGLTVTGGLSVTGTSQSLFYNGIYTRGGSPGASGVNNNGYAFFDGGDSDSGMYSLGDGQIEFYCNNVDTLDVLPDAVNVNGNFNVGGTFGAVTSSGAITSQTGFYESDRNGTASGQWVFYGHAERADFYSTIATADRMSIDTSGNVRAVGTFMPSTSPDLAETIAAANEVEVGDIVCADPQHRESAVRCGKDGRGILGVISDGSGGFLINSHGNSVDGPLTGKPLVLAGRVPVKICLENGPVQIGDTLAPSSIPGTAMRSSGTGPTIGIALDNFTAADLKNGAQTGMVLCFVKASENNPAGALQQMQNAISDRDNEIQMLKQRLDKMERMLGTKP